MTTVPHGSTRHRKKLKGKMELQARRPRQFSCVKEAAIKSQRGIQIKLLQRLSKCKYFLKNSPKTINNNF